MATAQGQVGPQVVSDGATPVVRVGRDAQTITGDAHGRLTEASTRGNLFSAHAIVTAPVIYTTAAGTGGPLIWNGTANKVINILKVGYCVTTASTVSGALGFTGNTGQTAAPSSTTAIDSRANLFLGGAASGSTPYRVGTVTSAGNFFVPFAQVHTGAVTVDTATMNWVDIDGAITVPPNGWVSVAGSATLTTAVMQIVVIYEELNF